MIKYVKSRTMAFTLISFLISLVLAGIIIAAAGYSPVEAYSAMLGGAFGSTYNLAQTAGTALSFGLQKVLYIERRGQTLCIHTSGKVRGASFSSWCARSKTPINAYRATLQPLVQQNHSALRQLSMCAIL